MRRIRAMMDSRDTRGQSLISGVRLKDILWEVYADRRSIHVGLLPVQLMGVSWCGEFSAAEPEESIPSSHPTAARMIRPRVNANPFGGVEPSRSWKERGDG
jgi:hypothetical protein